MEKYEYAGFTILKYIKLFLKIRMAKFEIFLSQNNISRLFFVIAENVINSKEIDVQR